MIGHFRKMDASKNTISALIWGISGFYICQIFGVKMINDKAEFIKFRLRYEKEINYVRNKGDEIHQEYPFIHKEKYLKGDDEIRLIQYKKFKNFTKKI